MRLIVSGESRRINVLNYFVEGSKWSAVVNEQLYGRVTNM